MSLQQPPKPQGATMREDRATSPTQTYLTLEDYLEQETKTELRHEYVNGQTFPVAGASRRHNNIVTQLTKLIAIAAEHHKHCQVFAQGMKLHVPAHNCVYYPDVFVNCDPEDTHDQLSKGPCAIIEVLSPSTSSIDRREKRLSYQTIPALREYLILDQNRMRAELHCNDGQQWTVSHLNKSADAVAISCLNLQLTLQQIYDGTELPVGVTEKAPEYLDDTDYWQPGFA